MEILTTAAALTDALAALRRRGPVGLVPTMGALHAGHRSLIAASVADNVATVVSVFVNPLQFGDRSDLERYPRDLASDAAASAAAGAAYLFAPAVEEMYPPPLRTTVHVAELGDVLEGASRPGHFDGVATVLARLFGLVGPCRAYFGEKDFQQLAVVRTLVRELHLPIVLVGCPTVRAPSGLALSSRNERLSPAGLQAASALHRALSAGADAIAGGESDPARVRALMAAVLSSAAGVEPDYAVVVDPETFAVPAVVTGAVRLLVAAWVEGVRLIDNLAALPPTAA